MTALDQAKAAIPSGTMRPEQGQAYCAYATALAMISIAESLEKLAGAVNTEGAEGEPALLMRTKFVERKRPAQPGAHVQPVTQTVVPARGPAGRRSRWAVRMMGGRELGGPVVDALEAALKLVQDREDLQQAQVMALIAIAQSLRALVAQGVPPDGAPAGPPVHRQRSGVPQSSGPHEDPWRP